MKKVLIAHQSTIPHYRVPFYNALEKARSSDWCFSVVFDSNEFVEPIYFQEPIFPKDIDFPLLDVGTLTVKIGSVRLSYQSFLHQLSQYDLIIVENAVNNLAYPFAQFAQFFGKKFAYWGHGRDLSLAKESGVIKHIAEQVKIWLVHQADGFFAYSPSVKAYLIEKGLPAEKLFVVNNSIDIVKQRLYFEKYKDQRDEIRHSFRVDGKKVLLFVGRLSHNKRISFLLDAFRVLLHTNEGYHLFIVGSGDVQPNVEGIEDHVTLFGSQTELDILAPIYVASDIYVITGAAGLGPLQANCFDLPSMVIDSPFHGPEIDYLTPKNGLLLPNDTTPIEYAETISQVFSTQGLLGQFEGKVWESVSHLTIENMAKLFALGVEKILGE